MEMIEQTSGDKKMWEHYGSNFVYEMSKFIRQDLEYKFFNIGYLKFDWNTNRTSSRGGLYSTGYGMNIAMTKSLNVFGLKRVYEYASFDNDKEIGGFYTDKPHDLFRMVLAHETSHALQRYCRDKNIREIDRPHGDSFKIPYRILRTQFVNSHLPDQEVTKKIYLELVSKIMWEEMYPELENTFLFKIHKQKFIQEKLYNLQFVEGSPIIR